MMLERVSQKILYYVVVGVMGVAIFISNCSIVTFFIKMYLFKKKKLRVIFHKHCKSMFFRQSVLDCEIGGVYQ